MALDPMMAMLPSMMSPIPQYGNFNQAAGGALGGANQLAQGSQGNQATYNAFAPGQMGMSGATGYNPADTTQAGQWLSGQFQQVMPQAQQIWNQAADPQQALYQRTAQQLQDQTRAAEAARGIATTPYGAGVEGNIMSNFNIDWQNNLLQRMLAGAQGEMGLMQGVGSGMTQGQGLAQAGPQFQQQTLQNLLGAQNTALAPQQQAVQDYLGYTGQATGAAQAQQQGLANAINAMYGAQQANQQQNQGLLSGLGQLFGGGLNMLSSGTRPWIFGGGRAP